MEQAGVFFLPPSLVSRFSGGLLGLPRGDAWSPCRKREIKDSPANRNSQALGQPRGDWCRRGHEVFGGREWAKQPELTGTGSTSYSFRRESPGRGHLERDARGTGVERGSMKLNRVAHKGSYWLHFLKHTCRVQSDTHFREARACLCPQVPVI